MTKQNSAQTIGRLSDMHGAQGIASEQKGNQCFNSRWGTRTSKDASNQLYVPSEKPSEHGQTLKLISNICKLPYCSVDKEFRVKLGIPTQEGGVITSSIALNKVKSVKEIEIMLYEKGVEQWGEDAWDEIMSFPGVIHRISKTAFDFRIIVKKKYLVGGERTDYVVVLSVFDAKRNAFKRITTNIKESSTPSDLMELLVKQTDSIKPILHVLTKLGIVCTKLEAYNAPIANTFFNETVRPLMERTRNVK